MRLSAPLISKTRLEQLLAGMLPDPKQHGADNSERSQEGEKEIHEDGSSNSSNPQ